MSSEMVSGVVGLGMQKYWNLYCMEDSNCNIGVHKCISRWTNDVKGTIAHFL